jgi:hypothetical protein
MLFQAAAAPARSDWVAAIQTATTTDDTETKSKLFVHTVNAVLRQLLKGLGASEAERQAQRAPAAAMVLFDALHHSSSLLTNKLDARSLFWYALSTRRVVKAAVVVAIVGHLTLGFFEPTILSKDPCSSGHHYARILELLCCAVHILDCRLRYRLKVSPLKDRWLVSKALLAVVNATVSIVLMAKGTCTTDWHVAELVIVTMIFRPLLVLDKFRKVRELQNTLITAVLSLKETLIITVAIITFYIMIGQTLYLETIVPSDTACERDLKAQAAARFETFHRGLSELMYLSLGAANFPDVMMPAFVQCRAEPLFAAIKVVYGPEQAGYTERNPYVTHTAPFHN